VFTYPIEGQNDVPVGSRIVVTFSERVTAGSLGPCTATSGAFCVVGPNGPVDATPTVSEDGTSVSFEGPLEPGTKYEVFARADLAPFAENLPSGALFSFTTRSDRPRAAVPALVSINGGDPTKVGTSFRPMFETSTLRLLFSEPLDPRTVTIGAGKFELLDTSGTAVPALIVCDGIHVSIDPKDDLTAGANYTLRLGNQILDLGGQALSPGEESRRNADGDAHLEDGARRRSWIRYDARRCDAQHDRGREAADRPHGVGVPAHPARRRDPRSEGIRRSHRVHVA
jgi:hypothetical protein